MTPIALTEQGGSRVLAYACGKCRMVVSSTISHGAEAEAVAAAHCEPRACACGAPVRQGWCVCDECDRSARWMREAARFVKAKRVDARTFGGPVFDPNERTGNEGYHASVDDLIGELEDLEDDERPFYVIACDEKRPHLDAGSVIEGLSEDHHEGAVFTGEDLLQQILDAWCASQTVVTWEPDYGYVVVLNEAAAAEYVAEYHRRLAAQGKGET